MKTLLAVLALAALPGTAAARSGPPTPLAITIDDIPVHGPLPPGETREAVARSMIATLKRFRVPAIGFINGSKEAGDSDAAKVLPLWRAAGLAIGDHSYSHQSLSKIGADAFIADIDRNAPYLKGARKLFRYPFLDEGDTPAVRDAVRAALAKRGDRIAALTMSFGDYAWNNLYPACAAKGPAALKALEDSYLAAARVDAERSRSVARAALGRDAPQVLLIHIGGMTTRVLPRLLAQYRAMGFTFADIDAVQRDPVYAATDPRLPGPTLSLEAIAQGRRITVPPAAPMPDPGLCR